jgi:DNA-binding beta-propeller fold protein YncE
VIVDCAAARYIGGMITTRRSLIGVLVVLAAGSFGLGAEEQGSSAAKRYLYVASPGVRNLLEYGGHGVIVFDIDQGYKFVKRIPTKGLDKSGKPSNVKGVCASAATGRMYISTLDKLQCLDLNTEQVLWERGYEGGCDRMSITPDGKAIYLPSLESDHWHVVDAASGDVITKITPKSGAHNTLVSLDGRWAYLAGLKSPVLTIADAQEHKAARKIEGFSAPVRPFTVNGKGNMVYACVNDLLGFEIGDMESGKMIHRLVVPGFKKGPIKRHGCPSHGVGLTPDEKEVWVVDAFNQMVHVYDNGVMPPKYLESIKLKDEPGWVTFTLDGKHAIPSTGDIIDVKTRKILTELKDEEGRSVMSEKMVEVQWEGGKIARVGDQFGVGRVR